LTLVQRPSEIDTRRIACSVHAEHRLITPGRLQVATHPDMRRVVTGFETRVARLTAAVVERVGFETALFLAVHVHG
jgi:hypothetical protein